MIMEKGTTGAASRQIWERNGKKKQDGREWTQPMSSKEEQDMT